MAGSGFSQEVLLPLAQTSRLQHNSSFIVRTPACNSSKPIFIEILQDASRYVEPPPISDTALALPCPNLSHATKDERIAIAFGSSLHNATRPHRNRFSAIANPRAALSEDDSSDAGGFSTPPRATRKSASAGAVSDHNDDVDANGEDFDEQDEEGEEDEDLEEDE